MYVSNQFVFKQIICVNDEEQLLRILRSLYFEKKCNNHKKYLFDFFLSKSFSAFNIVYININSITELSCWTIVTRKRVAWKHRLS